MFERYSARARHMIFLARWSAIRRGVSYIEPEDLLHALIREDRGEFAAVSAEGFPGAAAPNEESAGNRPPFFDASVATNLLRELREDPERLSAETRGEKKQGPVNMPVSHSLNKLLASVKGAHQNDTKTIEPLDLLAGILENRESRLAQLLEDHGITRQTVKDTLDSES